jgi:hypothetical protein
MNRQYLDLTVAIRRYISNRPYLQYLPFAACSFVKGSCNRRLDRNWYVTVSLIRTVETGTRSTPCPLLDASRTTM